MENVEYWKYATCGETVPECVNAFSAKKDVDRRGLIWSYDSLSYRSACGGKVLVGRGRMGRGLERGALRINLWREEGECALGDSVRPGHLTTLRTAC